MSSSITSLRIRKEHSLWICKVIVEAGLCPRSHVLFNEPGVGLTWFASACYRITQCYCSCPHTPQYRDILIPFFAWLVRQFTRAEGPWLNFPPRRMLGLSFVCTFASRMAALLFRKSMCACEHMQCWSEVCCLKQSMWGSIGSPVRESSEENSADVVPLSKNSQIIPMRGGGRIRNYMKKA